MKAPLQGGQCGRGRPSPGLLLQESTTTVVWCFRSCLSDDSRRLLCDIVGSCYVVLMVILVALWLLLLLVVLRCRRRVVGCCCALCWWLFLLRCGCCRSWLFVVAVENSKTSYPTVRENYEKHWFLKPFWIVFPGHENLLFPLVFKAFSQTARGVQKHHGFPRYFSRFSPFWAK